MGLLADDNQWNATMKTEASLTQSPASLRKLFCNLVVFSNVSDPYYRLWGDFKDRVSEDYLYHADVEARLFNTRVPDQLTSAMHQNCLLDMNDILNNNQYDLKTMEGFKDEYPEQDFRNEEGASNSNAHARMHSLFYNESLLSVDPDTLGFNESQKLVYHAISACALDDDESPNPLLV